MARAWPSVSRPAADGILDDLPHLQQAKGVRDRGTGPTEARCQLVLGEVEFVEQLAERERFLDRVEIRAKEVLHECKLELVARNELPHDRGNALQPGHLRRTQPALAGNQLIAVEELADEHWLEDAVRADAVGELCQGLLVHTPARLIRVAADPIDGDLDRRRSAGRRRSLGDQRREAAPEAGMAFRSDGHQAAPRAAIGRSGSMLPAASPRPSRRRSSTASERYASPPFESSRYNAMGRP